MSTLFILRPMLAINQKPQKKENLANTSPGFTLVELIIFISLIGLFAVMSSSFLFSSLSSSGKAEVSKEVRQNGNYALSVMEFMILNAREAVCEDPTTGGYEKLTLVDVDGVSTSFYCDSSESNLRIASQSAVLAFLTGMNISATGCLFACNRTEGKPTTIGVSFRVGQKETGSLKPSEMFSEVFENVVVAKNY